jgi:phenylacetate-CoA ligase
VSVDLSAPHSLLDVLDHCARRVPHYRAIEPPRPGEAPTAALARFPLLDKAALRRAFPHGLVPEGASLAQALRSGELSFVGTSGTSGERVQVLWQQRWWDAQELEGFGLHSSMAPHVVRAGFREAVLTTPVCSGNLCHVAALPMEARIEGGRTLFLNQTVDPSAWRDADVLRMADELERFRPDALEADPAYLAWFAVRLARLGRAAPALRFIDVSYEFPTRSLLAQISRRFDAPVIDTYGSTECGFVFCACEHGRYHHNAAWSHVELLPLAHVDGASLLAVTPLGNPWLNLVRFDTGDVVREARESCPCGRAGVTLETIEGRLKDFVVAASGELVSVARVDRAIGAPPGLLQWRLVQSAALEVELELVPDEFEPLEVEPLVARLGDLLGVAPQARVLRSLPVEASGKFRPCRAEHVDVAGLAGVAPTGPGVERSVVDSPVVEGSAVEGALP